MKASEYIKEYGLDIAKKAVSECTHGYGIDLVELKRLVESHELIKKVDFWGRIDKGLMKARTIIENNTLQASYFQPSSAAYYRYGHNSIYVVRDNEWKEIYGDMDSKSLIHTDRLKQAIADVESCQ